MKRNSQKNFLIFILPFLYSICCEEETILTYSTNDEWLLSNRYRNFGCSIGMNEEFLVAGSCRDNVENKTSAGSLSIFIRSRRFIFAGRVTLEEQQSNDRFGHAISLHKRSIVASALNHFEANMNQGAVYVINLDLEPFKWKLQQKLMPDSSEKYERFGRALGIYENHIVVGASYKNINGDVSGIVYVFVRIGEDWVQQAKLYPSEKRSIVNFGVSVAIHDSNVVVGASWEEVGRLEQAGCAYVFEKGLSNIWSLSQKLFSDHPEEEGHFGHSLAIDDQHLVIGAKGEKDKGGSVHVYAYVGSWKKQSILVSNPSKQYDSFGYSVAIHRNIIVVGAPFSDTEKSNAGCSYTFYRNNVGWVQFGGRSFAQDNGDNYWFGYSVAVDNSLIAVGSPNDVKRNGTVYLSHVPYVSKRSAHSQDFLDTKLDTDKNSIANLLNVNNFLVITSLFYIFINDLRNR